ncbi:hypothetical protein QYE76_026296 [Lolium multiflorum]|uniref:Reverse transcriptase zinc-binding domain-containing protein n=1 Tax=Lolium multiflorum TaxID=4521 RepID=A0AAD8VVG5_LOLMU|nr:hypothetical protein QYE76_026296 [Lolium multiflorum]
MGSNTDCRCTLTMGLFLRPDQSEAEAAMQLMQHFGEASGLQCNLLKSSASLIRCSGIDLQQLMGVLQCSLKQFPVCSILDPLPKHDLQPLVEKVTTHSWSEVAATRCRLGNGTMLKFWVNHWLDNRSVGDVAPRLLQHVKPASLEVTVADALANYSWVRMIKGNPSLDTLMDYLQLWTNTRGVVLREEAQYKVSWRLAANGRYSSKSAYEMFFVSRTVMPGADELWTAGAPLKHKIRMWLWTADRLARRGLQHPEMCPLCFQEEEIAEHLTLQCSKGGGEVNGLVILVARELWLERNARVFDKAAVVPSELIRHMKAEFDQWKHAKLFVSGDDRGIK